MEEQSDRKVPEWYVDLPLLEEDLMPVTQSLISPEIAMAFGIAPEACKAMIDLNLASSATCLTNCPKDDSLEPLRLFPSRNDADCGKMKMTDSGGVDESHSGSKDENGDDTGHSRAVKRPRLVWTPQLHKRFVDVIEHLGVDKAVPKTIMEMMNVEGLTRENVASHLQKYRLYLKRMEGFSNEAHPGPRRAPPLFEYDGYNPMPVQSQPPQQALHSNGMPLMPMPMAGPSPVPYEYGHMGLPVASSTLPGYCGLESGALNMFYRQRG